MFIFMQRLEPTGRSYEVVTKKKPETWHGREGEKDGKNESEGIKSKPLQYDTFPSVAMEKQTTSNTGKPDSGGLGLLRFKGTARETEREMWISAKPKDRIKAQHGHRNKGELIN